MGFGEGFGARFLLETEFGEALLLKTDVFKQNTAKTAILEENSEEEVLGLDSSMAGIVGNFPGFLQAMSGVEGQFLAKSCFKHGGKRGE
jgi:hypothetical protein